MFVYILPYPGCPAGGYGAPIGGYWLRSSGTKTNDSINLSINHSYQSLQGKFLL